MQMVGMVKFNKVSLKRELKKIVPIKSRLSWDCISIFDGLVFVQNVPKNCFTFGEVSD